MKGARVFRITKNRIVLLFFGGQCELFWFEIMDTIKLVVKKIVSVFMTLVTDHMIQLFLLIQTLVVSLSLCCGCMKQKQNI